MITRLEILLNQHVPLRPSRVLKVRQCSKGNLFSMRNRGHTIYTDGSTVDITSGTCSGCYLPTPEYYAVNRLGLQGLD